MTQEIRFFKADEVRQDPDTNCKAMTGGQLLMMKHAAGTKVGTHSHPEAHIIFIRRGQINFVVDGQVFECGTGDTLVVPKGTDHHFAVPDSGDALTACLAVK